MGKNIKIIYLDFINIFYKMMNSISDSSLITSNASHVNEETRDCNNINPLKVVIISFMIATVGYIIYYTFIK
jgi:hypothetical protein